jgi:ketosteroid isomerase-like protein
MNAQTQGNSQSIPAGAGDRIAARVRELLSYVQQGRIVDAMYEFYAPEVTMQENNNPPTVGLEANVEREKKFVASVRQWKRFDVNAVAVDPARGVAFVQSELEFEGVDGKSYRTDQVAVQTWRDGKIVNEKFYYDTGATK